MPKDNLALICRVAKLATSLEPGANLTRFLDQVVKIIADHMNATVCSIYFCDPEAKQLVLRATLGLESEAAGTVRLDYGEGIVGAAMEQRKTIRLERGSDSPHFKLIPGIAEEEHAAFLAVPIVFGPTEVGVMVVQHREVGFFGDEDEAAMEAIAHQLAGTIEHARLLNSLSMERMSQSKEECFIRGASGAPGVAIGELTVLGGPEEDFQVFARSREFQTATAEDFARAVTDTERQIAELESFMEQQQADVAATLIFSAHQAMLADDSFTGAMAEAVANGTPPAQAIADVVRHYADLLSRSPLAQLREKVRDVEDLGQRLLRNLTSRDHVSTDYSGCVVMAPDILPSDVMRLKAQKVAGVILTGGGLTAHVSILCRSLDIPMVSCRDPRLGQCHHGERILIDGNQGHVFLTPDDELVARYEALSKHTGFSEAQLLAIRPETYTADGVRVRLFANINLLSELPLALDMKAEGVGLYRSEFPYIIRTDFPTEEEQFAIYTRLLNAMEGRPVTFRTLDIGGDKLLDYFATPTENNPFLGLRAIRFSLRYRNIFAPQIRALLRAGADQQLRIMFPMVGAPDELIEAKAFVAGCSRQLAEEGIPHNPSPELGIMVELPSAVEMIDELAAEADFLSIGSNDLIQYLLAADRTNQAVADYYMPHHPAVLRALKRIVDGAERRSCSLSICGEMGGDPRFLRFLIGIGLRQLSLDVRRIPKAQRVIEEITATEAAAFADQALQSRTAREAATHFGLP
jgi:phosphotransferase system enzyme I (PtsP)